MAPQRNCSKRRCQDSTKQGRRDGTAQSFVDEREEFREGCGVVAGQSPPVAGDGENGADEGGDERKEDDEEETESCALRARGLGIDGGEGKGAVGGGHVIEIVYAVEDSYTVTK